MRYAPLVHRSWLFLHQPSSALEREPHDQAPGLSVLRLLLLPCFEKSSTSHLRLQEQSLYPGSRAYLMMRVLTAAEVVEEAQLHISLSPEESMGYHFWYEVKSTNSGNDGPLCCCACQLCSVHGCWMVRCVRDCWQTRSMLVLFIIP